MYTQALHHSRIGTGEEQEETERLVQAAKQGDDEALCTLILSRKDRLYRIALRFLRNEADALEAIQETSFRAYTGIGKLREPQYFNTWIVKILINCCICEINRRGRQLKSDHLSNEKAGASNEHDLTVIRCSLEQALERLKPKYRQTVILKYFEDMTIQDIALLLHKPEGTIKTWLYKALRDLKRELQKDGGKER